MTPWQRATSRAGGIHESASGFGDVNLLFKQRLTSADAPVQVAACRSSRFRPRSTRSATASGKARCWCRSAIAIPKTPLSLGLTPEVDWTADADGRGHHAGMAQVVSLGWQASDKLNLSAELWGGWDWDPAGTTRQASADGSVAYLLSNDVQLDAGANFGLNRVTPDVELYGGVSVRF